MSGYYLLDGHAPVPTDDLYAANALLGNPEAKRVALDRDVAPGGVSVSTVFLVLDHGWGGGPPLLFETMVFEGPWDCHQWRYCTWEQAERGHANVVRCLRAGLEPSTDDPEDVIEGEVVPERLAIEAPDTEFFAFKMDESASTSDGAR